MISAIPAAGASFLRMATSGNVEEGEAAASGRDAPPVAASILSSVARYPDPATPVFSHEKAADLAIKS